MNIMTPIAEAGYGTINTKRNAAWSSGDYRKFGVTLQITGEELAEAAEVAPGSTVLDVAAGNGNATLAFARRWCSVTSTDHVKNLLRAGRMRAEAEGLDVEFQVADAEDLPFEDGQFDAVVSSFGVMFAPNQQRAASEMLRVCRSGGIVAMASWTPESFIGALLRTVSRHAASSRSFAGPMGRRELDRRHIRGSRNVHRHPHQAVSVSLSVAAAFPGLLQGLLWSGSQGI